MFFSSSQNSLSFNEFWEERENNSLDLIRFKGPQMFRNNLFLQEEVWEDPRKCGRPPGGQVGPICFSLPTRLSESLKC